jgi:putative resolvase
VNTYPWFVERVESCWPLSQRLSVRVIVHAGCVRLSEWAKQEGIHYQTAWEWFKQGTLPVAARQTATGTILIDAPRASASAGVGLYARVSSSDQREDLERQVGRLAAWATAQGLASTVTVAEIGSGLNGSRTRLKRLLADPTVGTVVVEHRERLARFGVECIEAALCAQGRKLVVVEEREVDDDLVRDIIEVLRSMCARLYGRGSARRRAEAALAVAQEQVACESPGCRIGVAANSRLHETACKAIAAKYPWLAAECDRQMRQRDTSEKRDAVALAAWERQQQTQRSWRRDRVTESGEAIRRLAVGMTVDARVKGHQRAAEIVKVGRSRVTISYRVRTGEQRTALVYARGLEAAVGSFEPHAGRVVQAYRFALDPTPAQQRKLRSHAGAARFAYNFALARVKADLDARKHDPAHESVPWNLAALRLE